MVSKSEINNFISIFNSESENNMLMFNGEPFKADLAFQKIFKKAKDKIFGLIFFLAYFYFASFATVAPRIY